MTDPADLFAIDRQLGWLISLCGPLLMLASTVPVLAGAADFAPWWNIAGAALAAMVVMVAVAGRVLPAGLLRAWWVAAPLMVMVLSATTFLAYSGTDPDALLPWVWTFEAVLVTYQVLWLPTWAAIGGAVLSGLLPAVSGLLVLGAVPDAIAARTPAHASDLAFIVLFAGIRGRLRRLKSAEQHAERMDAARVRSAAWTRDRRRLTGIVHDDVLATLTAATAFTGRPPAPLRAQARHALEILEPAPPTDPGPPVLSIETGRMHCQLTDALRAIDPACSIDIRTDPGTVPTPVANAVVAAGAEALRNSVRHAGTGASRQVRGRLASRLVLVEIDDDGTGFDPCAIDPARLGVRSSIIERMLAVAGGDAVIHSRPGHGARVKLSWRT